MQVVLKTSDSIAASNEDILIQYLWENLKFSIFNQLDSQDKKQNSCDKIIEKAINIKAKAQLQPSFGI